MGQPLSDAELKHTIQIYQKHGTMKEAASELRIKPKTVAQRLNTACNRGLASKRDLLTAPKKGLIEGGTCAMTREQFMTKYDIRTRQEAAIREGLKRLTDMAGKNPEDDPIFGDQEFRNECCGGVLSQGFRTVAEQKEFIKYQFKVSEKVFWTLPRSKRWALENVSKARDMDDFTQ